MLEGVPVASPCGLHTSAICPHRTLPFTSSLPAHNYPQPDHIDDLPSPLVLHLLRTSLLHTRLALHIYLASAFAPERCVRPWPPVYFISCIPAPLQHSSRLSRPLDVPREFD